MDLRSHAITLVDDPTPPAELVKAVNAGRSLPASLLTGPPVPQEGWFAFLQGDLVVVLPRSDLYKLERKEKSLPNISPLLQYLISPREQEVLQALVEGLTPKQIALRLGVHNRTVAAHLKSLKDKLGAHTVEQSVGQAVSLGLVRMQPPGDSPEDSPRDQETHGK